MKGSKLMALLSSFVILGSYSGLAISSKYNLPEPQTPIAQEIYDQHMMALWICLAIFVGVFGVMGYSIVKHRKSVGYKAANFHHSTTIELIWTAIPVLILIAISWPATKTVIAMKDTSEADITIKATGYQWMWGYDYIQGEGEGISFYSQLSTPQDQIRNQAPKGEDYLLEVDNRVVVPTGKKIRVLMTANDVIHAWWVPALGVKQDAIPGFIRDAWFKVEKPGIYRGQCAELCGKEHGFMPVIVEVMEQEKYSQWVADKQKTASAAVVNTALVENEASKN
ncbi:cytochrome c oxidase subunit II [Nitrosomonas sp. HPC101]|uniref:cytochrome c oxidase subunit II n=1 Tax=Nitrosomonas sp. HPC101 TaxID=1658667 RepID=UPI00136CC0DC|nr:cytochrome c oxidase subunit II [Nitrosomonas sp. HPC101]MXS84856.1 cytochrome c oxidase subunit II [Nitrosomonas sp. HPC101]